MEKDTMIKFRSTIRGKNSKGGDRIQLYLTNEEATALLNEIQKTNGTTGVKLDIHTNKKTTEDGRTFDSSFGFCRAVLQKDTSKATTFVPKTDLKERIAKVKKEIA
jgi:hypothetical protein